MLFRITLVAGLFFSVCGFLRASDRKYTNYQNPTEYIFATPAEKIWDLLREIRGPKTWGALAGGYYKEEGTYGLGVSDYYTRRYWTGKQESPEDVSPPEAGRIGTIDCDFTVHVTAVSALMSRVSVTVESFTQQTGRHYRIYPHFRKTPVFIAVKSDTYFEYLFLTKLGELLGEKGMPLIKGEADPGAKP